MRHAPVAAINLAVLALATDALGASADINGDGRLDTIQLRSNGLGTPSTLQVTVATGRVLTEPA